MGLKSMRLGLSLGWLLTATVPLFPLFTGCGTEAQQSSRHGAASEDEAALPDSSAELTAAAPVRIFPNNVVMKKGQVSAQPLSVLQTKDEAGSADDWARYKDFTPAATGLNAQIWATLPAGIKDLTAPLSLDVNYRGWEAAKQQWAFALFDFKRNVWVPVGTNAAAGSWVWSALHFSAPGTVASYIDGSRRLLARYSTAQNTENSNLDYFAWTVTPAASTPVPPPAPAPAPGPTPPPAQTGGGAMYGVTLDGITPLPGIVASLRGLAKRPTARIVFDEFQPASGYADAVKQIHGVAGVMGELLDSYYVKQYTVDAYKKRTAEYVDALGPVVDIWEVGNEVNGEWLGSTSDVVAKISSAYDYVKQRGGKTELTLYYNPDCWAKPANEMFTWAKANIPARMQQGLDYVLISYYEDDCNGLRPSWQPVFDRLGELFPNSKIGFGEIGTTKAAEKVAYISRYYTLAINHPRYVGGYFWWYFRQDMVPATTPYWSALNQAIAE